MLFPLARAVVAIALKIYFRTIHVLGRENVPPSGPVVLAGNHPNSLVDPFVIGCVCGRRLHFMAKSGLFENPASAFFFKSLGAIPVYRRQDNPLDMSKNVEAFEEAYGVLERRDALGIFPEGLSHGDFAVRRIKSGVARIAFEAEARNRFSLGVTIVPVGLNFDDAAAFRSDLLVNIGRPIPVSKYRDAYLSNPQEAIAELIADVQRSLERLVLTVEKVDLADLVLKLTEVYGDDLRAFAASRRAGEPAGSTSLDAAAAEPSLAASTLDLKKRLAAAVDYFFREDPQLLMDVRERVDRYMAKLHQLRATDALIRQGVGIGFLTNRSLHVAALGLAGMPLALWGVVNNFLPYRLTRIVGTRLAEDRTELSTAKLATGILLFPGFYALQTASVAAMLGAKTAAAYLLTAAPAGLFAYFWSERMRRYREEIRFSLRYLTSRRLVAGLRRERRHLIAVLDRSRERYLKEVSQPSG